MCSGTCTASTTKASNLIWHVNQSQQHTSLSEIMLTQASCFADSNKQASAHPSNGPSAAASAADLEGLFTSASTPSQPQPQGPGPQLWPPQSQQQQQGRAGMGSPQAGMGSQPGFSQPGMEMQPGAQMGYMPGGLLHMCVCVSIYMPAR